MPPLVGGAVELEGDHGSLVPADGEGWGGDGRVATSTCWDGVVVE
jgi:hypothetical protein